MPGFLKAHKVGATIEVKVVPGAARDSISLEQPDALTVRLTAPPVEGRANKDLIRLLAKALGVAPSRLSLLSGEKSRRKVILAAGVSVDAAREAIARLGNPPRR